jgi:hypothetical protein
MSDKVLGNGATIAVAAVSSSQGIAWAMLRARNVVSL